MSWYIEHIRMVYLTCIEKWLLEISRPGSTKSVAGSPPLKEKKNAPPLIYFCLEGVEPANEATI